MELAACEKTPLALDPIRRTVPTTSTRITASMTAYSAMSCPWSSDQSRDNRGRTDIVCTFRMEKFEDAIIAQACTRST